MMLLHIITRADSLAEELIQQQRNAGKDEVTIADLRVTSPDYDTLLDQIFSADSIHVC
jgi:hypothetical protein